MGRTPLIEPPVGTIYGRLLVVGPARRRNGFLVIAVSCSCSPGIVLEKDLSSLVRGGTKSCGCWRRELSSTVRRRHGQSAGNRTRTYRIWRGMKNRCLNQRSGAYKSYGGRGITIDTRWLSFEGFYRDMGDPPSTEHSLGRLDNDGPYNEKNCAWQTKEAQCNNTRHTRRITCNGKTRSLSQWAHSAGLKPHTLRARLEAGWDIARALSTPSKAA
jgi:hypothetical protein